MADRGAGELPADLRKARHRFDSWRRTKKPGARIPASLWQLAVRLSGVHGVHATARALGLDYYSLKRRGGERSGGGDDGNAATFIELAPGELAPGASLGECIVELEDGAGARLRVTLRGHAAPDVAALARGFWDLD